jgi:hypothetical protein
VSARKSLAAAMAGKRLRRRAIAFLQSIQDFDGSYPADPRVSQIMERLQLNIHLHERKAIKNEEFADILSSSLNAYDVVRFPR